MSYVTLVSVAQVVRWVSLLRFGLLACLLGSCNPTSHTQVPMDPEVGWARPILDVYVFYGDVFAQEKISQDIELLQKHLEPTGIGVDAHLHYLEDTPETVRGGLDHAVIMGFLESHLYLAQVHTRTLHVVYVGDIIQDDGDELSGLHVTKHDREIILVDTGAPRSTLTHEIGHALSLEHVKDPKNIMCSCQREDEPIFTRYQSWKMFVSAWERVQRS